MLMSSWVVVNELEVVLGGNVTLQHLERDLDLWMPGFDLPSQLQYRQSGTVGAGVDQARIEPLVEVVIPRDDGTRQTAEEQKTRNQQARPAVEQSEARANPRSETDRSLG